MEKEIKENLKGDDELLINGLSKSDWSLTLRELEGQLRSIALQKAALLGGITQVKMELEEFD